MTVRTWIALLAATTLCLLAYLTGQCQAQQLETGSLTITVTDAQTSAPIDNAEVFLISEGTPQSSLSDARGKLTFPDLQPGVYRIEVHHAGYDKGDAREFEVTQGARVLVAVKLAPTIKEIGAVTARSSIAVTTESVNDSSPERKLSQSLKDAMSKMAGVSIDDTTYENSAFNISLRNHDASQTGYSVDGMRVAGPAGQSLGAAQDLFTGASVNFNPTAGFLGGIVTFQTLRPTKTWAFNASGTLGNFGAGVYAFSATGTVGRIGMALTHSMSVKDSFLSGLSYADQSGHLFEHIGGNQTRGDLAKFSIPLSQRATLNFSTFVTNSESGAICSDFVTLSPCGFGSVPRNRNHSAFSALSLTSLVGNVETNVFASLNGGRYSSEDSRRALDGAILPPFESAYRYRGASFGANGSITARRHTGSFGVYVSNATQDSVQTINGAPVSLTHSSRSSETFFNDKVKSNDRLALTHGITIASATGSGSSLVLSEDLNWTPAKNDAFAGRISVGSAQPGYFFSNAIGDPVNASFDCFNHSTFVNGPQDPPVPQSSVSYNFSWQHKLRTGNLNVSLYRQNAYGQSFYAAVPAAAEPASIFPSGLAQYLSALQQVWNTQSICGNIPFDPSKVYVSQSISGTGQVYEGYSIHGNFSLGRNVSAFPSYSVGSTFLSALDPRLEFPGSFYAAGAQLPHRPLRTANLILDGAMPKAHLEWILGAQFTDVNNTNNLPAYTVYNAGMVLHTHYGGTLTLVESNIFGTHTGLFSTYLGEDPHPLTGGGTFAYSTVPLPPRQWAITWRVPWQQKAPPAPAPAPAAKPVH